MWPYLFEDFIPPKCQFHLVDRARDAHGTKADWRCVVHKTNAASEKECERERAASK